MERKAGRVKDVSHVRGPGGGRDGSSVLCSPYWTKSGEAPSALKEAGSLPRQLSTSALGSCAGGPGDRTDRET